MGPNQVDADFRAAVLANAQLKQGNPTAQSQPNHISTKVKVNTPQ